MPADFATNVMLTPYHRVTAEKVSATNHDGYD